MENRSIKNPIAVLCFTILIVALSVIAGNKLPLQLLPDITQSQISITTSWGAAAPAEMNANIVEPQEQTAKDQGAKIS